jgi:hypothetical protein
LDRQLIAIDNQPLLRLFQRLELAFEHSLCHEMSASRT